jgi:hypothetical protein
MRSQAPAEPPPSMPTSSDGNGVSWPSCAAAIWSIETPPKRSGVCRGCTQVSQVPGTMACTVALMPGRFSRPETMVSLFLNGSSGFRMGVISKSAPSAFGVQWSMMAPCGK